MTNKTTFYPYQQNNLLLRRFFAKPITLITAIILSISSLLGLFSFNSFASVTNITLCIVLFVLYTKCKSNKPYVNINGPFTALKVVAIVNIVANSITLLLLLLVSIIYTFIHPYAKIISGDLIPISLCYVFLLLALSLFIGIFLLKFANGVKKSLNSVFIYKNGAAGLGIMFLINSIATIFTMYFVIFFLSSLYSNLIDSFRGLAQIITDDTANKHLVEAISKLELFKSYFTFDPYYLVVNIVFAVSFITIAIFLFSYRHYVVKQTTSINYSKSHHAQEPVQPYVVNNKANTNTAFTPQSVKFESKPPQSVHTQKSIKTPTCPSDSDELAKSTAPDTPDKAAEPVKPSESTAIPEQLCPKCGNVCNPYAVFCGNCGTKLK